MPERYLDNKNYPAAEKYFQIAIKKYPLLAYNYINYSAFLIEIGKPGTALSYLNKAGSLTMTRDERGQWFNNKGMAFFRLGRMGEAIKNFEKSVLFSPGNTLFRANFGGIYGELGDYENAVSVLKTGLDFHPDDISLKKNLAITYINMKDYREAIAVLKKIPRKVWDRQGISRLLERARRGLNQNR